MALRLRLLAAADRDRVLAWRNSEAVAPYMYSDHLISGEEHDRWLAATLAATDRRYWIIEWNGAPVGLANVLRIDRQSRRCEWAYYLADPATRGQGLGSAIEYLVLRHVFETLGLNKLWCEVLEENQAVWKLHETFGFVREALLRDHVCKAGRFHDVVGLGLLARDWPTTRAWAESKLAAKGFSLADLSLEP